MDFQLTALEREALNLSLWVSLWAVIGSLPVGVFLAWILSRKSFPGKTVLDGLLHLPLVLPPVVTGYLLLVTFGRKGVVGAWLYDTLGITFAFNWKGAALASAVVAFPLMVRAIRLSMDSVDRDLEWAARTLGATRIRVFFTITLPLTAPGILTGMILSFARSLSEFGATITFVSNIPGETRTLPLALYTLTQVPGGEQGAMRLCVISIILAMLALILSNILATRAQSAIKG